MGGDHRCRRPCRFPLIRPCVLPSLGQAGGHATVYGKSIDSGVTSKSANGDGSGANFNPRSSAAK